MEAGSRSGAPTTAAQAAGVQSLCDAYDVWLLDQFGVLHDGIDAYPRAVEACRRLSASGKKLLVISNSSRRATTTLGKLGRMGFDSRWFSGAVTSGELAHARLSGEVEDARFDRLRHRRVLWMTWAERGAPGTSPSLEGLGLEPVEDATRCDFVLVHGTEAVGGEAGAPSRRASLDELKELLRIASARRVTLVCANPDLVTVAGAGSAALAVMPGTLAKFYEELGGGPVIYTGKPDPAIYAAALALVPGADRSRCVAVGDSLAHDVRGAQACGVDSVFVAGGIHARELNAGDPAPSPDAPWGPDWGAVPALSEAYGLAVPPTHLLPWFAW